MGNLAVALVVIVATTAVVRWIIRNSTGIVAQRGIGVGADLGVLSDAPQVRVAEITRLDGDRVRVVLEAVDPETASASLRPDDLDLVVSLDDSERGSALLEQWRESGGRLGLVLPPDTHLVNLRSLDDLKSVTLHRIERNRGA